MLNIVLPMAGRGSRFVDAGYEKPKPLIEVHGKPMIDVVVHNISPKEEHRFIFVVLKEQTERYGLKEHLRQIAPGCEIVEVSHVTEGAACTVLLTKEYIDNEEPLMIANCDQWVDIDINEYLAVMKKEQADGLIMTMKADDPKWSFVEYGADGRITGIREKEVVSEEATVGIYNYVKGSDFVRAAETMMKEEMRVNNEFYVAPAYNLLLRGHDYKIVTYNIGAEAAGMYGLGTPKDLEAFLHLDISRKAASWTGRD